MACTPFLVLSDKAWFMGEKANDITEGGIDNIFGGLLNTKKTNK
jgi:hypothetical protein